MLQAFLRDDVKDVIRGIAATLMLIGVAVVSPLLGIFSTFFIPLPVLYCRVKLGRRKGLIVPVATLAILTPFFGWMLFDLLLLSELILGFMLGELIDAKVSIEKTVAVACCTVLAFMGAVLLIWAFVAGTSVYDLASGYVTILLEKQVDFWKKLGMPSEFLRMFVDSLDIIRDRVISILPGCLAAAFLFLSWISLLMARAYFRRSGMIFPDYGPLTHWKAPEILVWGVIVCGVMWLLPVSGLKIIGRNGTILFLTVFFFEGIAVVAFFFEKKQFPGIVRVFFYSLIMLQQLILLLVVGLGLFDVWLNFRKLGTEKSN